jgi:hypothetical protein
MMAILGPKHVVRWAILNRIILLCSTVLYVILYLSILILFSHLCLVFPSAASHVTLSYCEQWKLWSSSSSFNFLLTLRSKRPQWRLLGKTLRIRQTVSRYIIPATAALVLFIYTRTIYMYARHCATSLKVAGSIPDEAIGIFHWQSFRPHYGPGVDMASNRNE